MHHAYGKDLTGDGTRFQSDRKAITNRTQFVVVPLRGQPASSSLLTQVNLRSSDFVVVTETNIRLKRHGHFPAG